jgi:hypothetical protein
MLSVVIIIFLLVAFVFVTSFSFPMSLKRAGENVQWCCPTCFATGSGDINRYHYAKRLSGYKCKPVCIVAAKGSASLLGGNEEEVREEGSPMQHYDIDQICMDEDDFDPLLPNTTDQNHSTVDPPCIKFAKELYDKSYGRAALASKNRLEFDAHVLERDGNASTLPFLLNEVEMSISRFCQDHVHLSKSSGEALLELMRNYHRLQTLEDQRIESLSIGLRY